MNHARLIDAEFYFTGFGFTNGRSDVRGNGSGLGVRHQSTRTEQFAQARHTAHHVRRGHDYIVIEPIFLENLFDHLVATEEIGTGVFRGLDFVARGNDEHPNRLTQTIGQDNRAADHLVGLLGVDTEAHVHFNGFVEFGVLDLLNERYGFSEAVKTSLHLFSRSGVLLTWFIWHILTGPNDPGGSEFALAALGISQI